MESPFDDARSWFATRPGVTDAVVAATLVLFGALSLVANFSVLPADRARPSPAAVTVSGLLIVVPLAWRRRAPLAVALVVSAGFLWFRLLDTPEGAVSSIALFLALYGAGAYGQGRARDVVRGLLVAVLMVALLVTLVTEDFGIDGNVTLVRSFAVGFNIFFFASAWLLGDLTRVRRQRERELAARTAELERERERNAEQAVVQERLRIARELHDVLAHHVSVMGVQAGAARRILARHPDQATEALASIEEASRRAVVELQRMLGFLRAEEAGTDDGPRAPQPGLRSVEQLADDVSAAGLPVRLHLADDLADVPASVGLSTYRIVQEALTNALKHGGQGTKAEVSIRRDGDDLVVVVEDDGRGPGFSDTGPVGTRSGILGMRERATLHGGRLDAGARAGGGFRVRAVLPLGR